MVGRSAGDGVLSDGALVGFLQGVELAVVALYAQTAAVVGSPDAAAAIGAFAVHHRAHARAFAELAGPDAVAGPSPAVLEALQPASLLVSERDGLAFLHTLESRLAATQHAVLGRLAGAATIALCATTLPVECQHAVVLGTLLSLPLAELVPTAQGDDGHIAPEQFVTS
jgi:hypothetical protein